MAAVRQGTADQVAFREELVERGILIASGVPGLYGRGETFESIRRALDLLITELSSADGPESMSFPPLIPRRTLETIGYLHSFPHLAGSVFSFEGDEAQALVGDHQPRRERVAQVPPDAVRGVVAIAGDADRLERALADAGRALRRRELEAVEAQDAGHRHQSLAPARRVAGDEVA